MNTSLQFQCIGLATILTTLATAADISDNLDYPTAGTETAGVNNDLAASFSTNTKAQALSHATLMLAGSVDAVASLALHADGGLEPGAFVATLTAPGTIPLELDPATFTGAEDLILQPDATYWLVLTAEAGTLQWGWTDDDSDAGPGFERMWATMDHDTGLWWCQDRYALQTAIETHDDTLPCPGDSDGNGAVDANDVLAVIAQWGQAGGDADVNGDGIVNVNDLLMVVNAWGPCR